jgi:hydrogenase maturation protease
VSDIAVVCIGNRFAAEDAIGCEVYERLTAGPLAVAAAAEDVDIVDGGLCGLDLLRVVEGRRRVVFVDAVAGVAAPGDVVVLAGAEVAAYAGGYGHAAGLPYLLHMLPQVCAAPLPEVALVGAEGYLDDAEVEAMARRSLEVALHGTT